MRADFDFRKRITPADQARDLLARGWPIHAIKGATGLSAQSIVAMINQPPRHEKTRPRAATFRFDQMREPEPMPEPKTYRERSTT